MLFDKIKVMAQVIGFICIGLLAIYGGVVVATGGPPAWAAGAAAPAAPEAITPALISYQGTLRDAGDNLANGTYDMVVKIYDNAGGAGTALWCEGHNGVTVREGHFNLLLGSGDNDCAGHTEANPVPQDIFTLPDRWVELTVDGTEMTPCQRFAAVPYAIAATYATKLSAPDGDPAEAVWVSDGGDVHVGSSDQQSTMVALHGITPTLRFNHGAGQAEVDLRANGGAFEIIEPDDGDDLWLKINDSGQVGIGKEPEVKLDVNGDASVSGKLGVGTTSPDQKLSVIGTIRGANDADETEYTELGHGGTNGYINTVGTGDLDFRHDGNTKMSLNDAGDLDVDGNVDADSLTIDGSKPIFIKKLHASGNYQHWDLNKSTTNWVCGVVGFWAHGDIKENPGDDYELMVAYAFPDTDGDWHLKVDFAGHGDNECWDVVYMCIDKDMASYSGF